jgi:hypothetical protein
MAARSLLVKLPDPDTYICNPLQSRAGLCRNDTDATLIFGWDVVNILPDVLAAPLV